MGKNEGALCRYKDVYTEMKQTTMNDSNLTLIQKFRAGVQRHRQNPLDYPLSRFVRDFHSVLCIEAMGSTVSVRDEKSREWVPARVTRCNLMGHQTRLEARDTKGCVHRVHSVGLLRSSEFGKRASISLAMGELRRPVLCVKLDSGSTVVL